MVKQIYLVFLIGAFGFWPSTDIQAQETAGQAYDYGVSALEQRNYSQAVKHFSKAIAMNPFKGRYFEYRAKAFLADGKYREAYRDFSTATNFLLFNRRRKGEIFFQRGLCLYYMREYSKALSEFNHSIMANPRSSSPFYYRGKIQYLVNNRQDEARRDFERVIKRSQPGETGETIQYAFALHFLGRHEEATGMLRELTYTTTRGGNVDPDQARQAYYSLAGMYALQGNTQASLINLEKCFRAGFREWHWLSADRMFDRLRYNNQYANLVSAYVNGGPVNPIFVGKQPIAGTTARMPVTIIEPEPEPCKLVMENLRFNDENKDGSLEPDEKGALLFTLFNDCQQKVENLEIRLDAGPGASALDFPGRLRLGDMAPNEEVKINLPVRALMGVSNETFEFTINVAQNEGNEVMTTEKLSLATREPAVASLVLVDYQFQSRVGEELLPGVPIVLRVGLHNEGSLPAEQVQLQLELPDKVFSAGELSQRVGTVRPGEWKYVNFEFFSSARYTDANIPLRMVISSPTLEEDEAQTLVAWLESAPTFPATATARGITAPKPEPEPEPEFVSDVETNLPPLMGENPDAVAVVIGNVNYKHRDVPDVDYAGRDARTVKKYLVESFGFDPANILFMENATLASFNSTFGSAQNPRARLYNLVKPDQSDVFVFYSGHGAPDPENGAAFFLPVDCDPSLVAFNAYSLETLYQNLSELPYRSLTLVIDACFSGQSERGTLIPNVSPVYIKPKIRILQDERAVVLTAARGNQLASWNPESKHGLFTYLFLKGLQGAANVDGNSDLTVEEMRNYLEQEVPYQARRLNNRTQNPEIYGENQRVIFSTP